MHFLTLASIALTAAAGASAIVIPRSHVHHARIEKPDTYYEGYLEPYATYHARYMAIDCEDKHNTSYFDRCCHPMLATETLAKNRDADCNPANLPKSSSAVSTASASASVASAAPSATSTQILSSTGDDGDDDDCEDDEPTSTASSAAPTSTSSDDGDDDDDDCDDEGDEPSSSAAPSTTHVATSSTHVASSTHVVTSSTHSATTEAVTTSSTHVATTSSTHTTKVATTTKTSSTPTSTSSSGGSDTFSGGHATFFYQGGQAGACGTVHSDDSLVAAIQTKRYGNLSAKSSNCGRKIKLINTNNKKSVTVTVADACPTCPDENDLDLSVGAFTQIATEEEGEVPITWNFLD
ncbi:barwin-like endoglucanase [Lentinus tigrinus ALCF2SS1-7]|uniref:Barwin-like endoglucanase n=1 Tax=Lentinus tigrinus ALCF2SS1-6 TaxID=1328759 RepID=A0A5C2SS27_9APHY|nr:barwin-like endoglucanase [Lentinus tigrinus ALCF2SS1-6]RPD80099.1 barwin-like endoglucanase [Lentinus tigrinus ALCF2SS1-7]